SVNVPPTSQARRMAPIQTRGSARTRPSLWNVCVARSIESNQAVSVGKAGRMVHSGSGRDVAHGSDGAETQRLEAKDIVVAFGGLTAIDGVSMCLESGEILGLIGPNGAGKTTLVNVLTGFQRPSRGRVYLGGVDITGRPAHRVARAGLARTF